MKKQMIAGGILLVSLGAASAQGLYDIGPNDDLKESLPISWTASVNLGYNDNVSPSALSGSPSYKASTGSINAHVGASWVSVTPQTTWDVYGRLGGTWYFDPAPAMSQDVYGNARLGVNWSHRVSERLRFSSRNYLSKEMEPDYNYGYTLDRQLDPYFHWTSDNSVGYKWSERWGTYTGIRYSGVVYGDEASNNDRQTLAIYHQFRYRSSEQTVWTLDYRYSGTVADGFASDSVSQFLLVGAEHRFSPNTVGVMKVGAQFRSPDLGDDLSNPYFQGALRSQVNEQFSVRAFARYGMESYGTSFGGYAYDYNNAFRLGISGSYTVSPQWSLFGGINYIRTDMTNASVPGISDLDQNMWNLNIGFSYKVNDAIYLTGSYNYTNSSANGGAGLASDSRTYSQNRASLGVRFQF